MLRDSSDPPPDPSPLEGLVGSGAAMREVYAMTRRVAASNASVLLKGETGTGKELIARAIHRVSPRGSGPFVRVNCGALSEGLLESELFGHVRGAFTDAVANRTGKLAKKILVSLSAGRLGLPFKDHEPASLLCDWP